jgi:hypothetical protein
MTYPEPLYYGTSTIEFNAHVPSTLFANPFIFLVMVSGLLFILIYILDFLFIGYLCFRINKKEFQKKSVNYGEYLTFNAYSYTPILFIIPLITFWKFFFERLLLFKRYYPFIDWNPANILFISILGLFYAWKFIIQYRMNRVFIKSHRLKAILPMIIEIGMLLGILTLPLLLNDLFFELLTTSGF